MSKLEIFGWLAAVVLVDGGIIWFLCWLFRRDNSQDVSRDPFTITVNDKTPPEIAKLRDDLARLIPFGSRLIIRGERGRRSLPPWGSLPPKMTNKQLENASRHADQTAIDRMTVDPEENVPICISLTSPAKDKHLAFRREANETSKRMNRK